MLAAARDEYAAESLRGRGGSEVVAHYADRMDGLVRHIAEAASRQTTTPWAVCAIGGYGRRALCLHSGVDKSLDEAHDRGMRNQKRYG